MAEKRVIAEERRRLLEILRILKRTYPEARCSLDFKSPFQLLIATILSAQCTDERVNQVTPSFFKKYPTPETLATADLKDLEHDLRSVNFFRNKAKSLKMMAQTLVDQHGGTVPSTLEGLTALRGVGRKTANVILGNAFETPSLVVDTHVGRLCRRMGFTREADPERIEFEMMRIVPKEDWSLFSHLLIFHGRAICRARRALCGECPISHYCPKIGVASEGSGDL